MTESAAAGLVSVVIPVHNGRRFLREAIDSVLAQAHPVEVIVVDDGSTDDSAALAEGYGATVTCLRQPQKGVSAARNAGVNAARGEFLAFLDQDDVWLSDKLSWQVAQLNQDAALDCVFGLVEHFHDGVAAEPYESRAAAGIAGLMAGSMLIRRQSFLRLARFPTDARLGEFLDWYARASEAGMRSAVLPRVALRRRIHGENATVLLQRWRTDYPRILRAALDRRHWAETPPAPGLVSVVIPVYNGERFLRQAVDSVLAQSYQPLEVVVIDDGSTDNSRAIAEDYGAPVVCIHQANGGLGAARNAGVRASKGEYIAFLDADDTWEPDKLRIQITALEEDDLECVFGLVNHMHEDGTENLAVKVERGAPAMTASAMLIRRSSFLRVGYFWEERVVGEFIDWFGRARDRGLRIGVPPQHVLNRRIHGGNMTLHTGLADGYLQVVRASLERRRLANGASRQDKETPIS